MELVVDEQLNEYDLPAKFSNFFFAKTIGLIQAFFFDGLKITQGFLQKNNSAASSQ